MRPQGDSALQHWQALGYAPPEEMLEIAPVAEEAGFEGLLLSDHVFVPEVRKSKYPYSEDGEPDFPSAAPFPESFVLMGVLAQRTTRLRFATNVYILPCATRSRSRRRSGRRPSSPGTAPCSGSVRAG